MCAKGRYLAAAAAADRKSDSILEELDHRTGEGSSRFVVFYPVSQ